MSMSRRPNQLSRTLIIGVVAALSIGAVDAASDDVPAVKRQPGSWAVTILVEELEAGENSETIKNMMQDMMNKDAKEPFCLTPAKAQSEDFVGNAIGRKRPGECTVLNQNMEGDTLNLSVSCNGKAPNGDSIGMQMDGTISPTSAIMTLSTKGPATSQIQRLKMRTTNTRVGECTPGQKEI